jgi:hypothetical protein
MQPERRRKFTTPIDAFGKGSRTGVPGPLPSGHLVDNPTQFGYPP